MKLIALRDFANNSELEIADKLHEKHVHKGAIFEIGPDAAKELKDLKASDRQLVATLIVAKCVGDANDKKVVAAVRGEIEVDQRREKTAKELDEKASGQSALTALTALLAKAAASVAPAPAPAK